MKTKSTVALCSALALLCVSGCNSQVKNNESAQAVSKKMNLFIILGSTRQGRMSDKIANALNGLLHKRTDINTQLIDLRDYQLPFLDDAAAPSRRKTITDPVVQKWSDTIKQADGFIIVTPEYNAGYPGVLKNALDLLYVEWNNKPVGLVSYSGGPSGGSFVVSSLRPVMDELKMILVDSVISIPTAWKALDAQGNLLDATIEGTLNTMVDHIIQNISDK
jgi:NAD(P)H-dependent FMN reductase